MDLTRLAKVVVPVFILGAVVFSFLVFRDKRKRMALALFSCAFTVFVLEVLLRLFWPQIMEHDSLFQYDPDLGWSAVPNRTATIVYPGEAHHRVRTNSMGFRDDWGCQDGGNARRVLVLGDSFVSNLSVGDEDVFTEVLQQRLENTRVLNLGVNGYGQVQEYLLLQKWLARTNPDLVILMIYVGNDFTDNTGGYWLYQRPFATWSEDTQDIEMHAPLPSPVKEAPSRTLGGMVTKMHLFWFVERRLSVLTARFFGEHSAGHSPSLHVPPERYLCRSPLSEDTMRMYRTMEALLLEIQEYMNDKGIPLVFAVAPTLVQVDDDLWYSMLRQFCETQENQTRTLPNDMLRRFAAEHDLLMLDLLPVLQSETKKGKPLYNRKEQHWNAAGNRVVAEALLEYLKEHGFVDR
jgi:lysophospholipase L1-like esterase